MSNTVEEMKALLETAFAEDAKFFGGNNAAGTRARKAYGEVAKLIKARRNEVTAEKNARAEAKKAA
tara:strand:- start:1630 stop:1827 length:198 start_codon:yes stop_codon:yes gene_type:complete